MLAVRRTLGSLATAASLLGGLHAALPTPCSGSARGFSPEARAARDGAAEAPPGEAAAAAAPRVVVREDPDSGEEILGHRAPPWRFDRWVRGPARTLGDLRGKVVLLRWWTEGCHFCEATLPALEALRRAHASDDLVVIGVFHPKPPRELEDRRILRLASQLGFSGPVAFDRDWRTLGRYWLDGHPDRSWTSVSFLIDREGVIRWVHGGGEYHPSQDPRHRRCDVEHRGLVKILAEVLAEAGRGR